MDCQNRIIIEMQQNNLFDGSTRISNDTITLDGEKAYENIYFDNNTLKNMRVNQIYFVKNDITYVITLQANTTNFDNEKSNFNIILNSFKVINI